MNLREFLGYRDNCLSCGDRLSVRFLSTKKQTHRLEKGKFISIFDMNGMNKNQKSYKVEYCVDMVDGSLSIDFHDQKDNVEFNNSIPLRIISIFNKFHKNVTRPKISKGCWNCDQYYYESSDLVFDFKNSKLNEFEIRDEWARFSLPTNDKFKIYEIWNQYDIQISELRTYKSNLENGGDYNRRLEPVKIPILQFNSKIELGKRIDTVMPFL